MHAIFLTDKHPPREIKQFMIKCPWVLTQETTVISVDLHVYKQHICYLLAAGLLSPGGTVVEGTAGNTGIGLAHMCNALGYKCVIFMPDTQSQVRLAYLHIVVYRLVYLYM